MRSVFVACGLLVAALPAPAAGQTTQPSPSPVCTMARLVGTWERVSLLRNALSVQPPDAPLFVKFGSDGYWSMMEMPPRAKIDKPFAQMTAKDLWSLFERVEGGYGTWSVKGDVVSRRHILNIAAGGENTTQDRTCSFENEILALIGVNPGRTPQARFKRLAPQPLASTTSTALVGTWQRTSLVLDGKETQPPTAPLVLILGEDGWFSQTQLPAGRKPAGKPLEQFTVEDYRNTFNGVAAGRGTYTVEGAAFTRKFTDNIDPDLIGYSEVRQFTLTGDMLVLRGASKSGAKLEAKFQRLKPSTTTSQ
jgi:Lipocalin-like domain